MTFSKAQQRTAWCSFAVMAGMLLVPPWLWRIADGSLLATDRTPYYDWVFAIPDTVQVPVAGEWRAAIYWPRLVAQWLVVAVGMLTLLFLREVRERRPQARRPGLVA